MASRYLSGKRRQRQKNHQEMLSQFENGQDDTLSSSEQTIMRCEILIAQTTKLTEDTLEQMKQNKEMIDQIHKKTWETKEALHDCNQRLRSVSSWQNRVKNFVMGKNAKRGGHKRLIDRPQLNS